MIEYARALAPPRILFLKILVLLDEPSCVWGAPLWLILMSDENLATSSFRVPHYVITP